MDTPQSRLGDEYSKSQLETLLCRATSGSDRIVDAVFDRLRELAIPAN